MSKSYSAQVAILPQRTVKAEGEISAEKMQASREVALKKLAADAELSGFRKGAAPLHLVAQKIGEMKLVEEAASHALSEVWQDIVSEHKLEPFGDPSITITKIGIGAPLSFTITSALRPDVKLADYKALAKKVPEEKAEDATDKEIDGAILELRRNVAHAKLHREHGDNHKHEEIKDADLPEADEEFLNMIGGFQSADDLKAKIGESIRQEKEMKARDKRRTEILEKIIGESTIDIPRMMIDGELSQMLAQFKEDVARAGVSYEDYLKHIKKSEDDLKKEWEASAEKRAKSQIALAQIAREGGIAPEEADVKREMENILSRDKDLDRFRVRMFVEQFLTNELVLRFLEKQS